MNPIHQEVSHVTLNQILQQLDEDELNTPKKQQQLTQIANKIFESRRLAFSVFGLAFPMYAEIFAMRLPQVKGKVVLEMAGAGGEHSILMAAAGAKKAYYNDITELEIEGFKKSKQKVSKSIRDKLEIISGDCLTILEKRPDLSGKVDFILCRNLIHFFKDEDHVRFFQLVKNALSPEGRAEISVTAKDDLQDGDPYPDHTIFEAIQCFVYDKNQTKYTIYKKMTPISNESLSMDFEKTSLYERSPFKNNGKWEMFPDNFKKLAKLPGQVQDEVKKACKDKEHLYKHLKDGAVKMVISKGRAYSLMNLQALIQSSGFKAESMFAVNVSGHIHDGEGTISQFGATIYPE